MDKMAVQLARYLLTGGTAAGVDVGGFALLLGLGMAVGAAAVGSFCLAAIVNYCLTARFVFGAGTSLRGFGLFFAVALVGLAINVGATLMLVRHGVPPVAAKIGGIGIAFVANFAMNKLLVFGRPRAA